MNDKPPDLEHIAPNWFHTVWRKMMAYVAGIRPVEGPGISITDAPGSGGGRMISCTLNAAALAKKHPFEVVGLTNDKVSVTPGTVNSLVPETIDGAAAWQFDIPEDDVVWIYLAVDLAENGLVSFPELFCESEVPEQPEGNPETGTAPSKSYRPVAKVTRTYAGAPVIENYLISSQWVATVVSGWNCDLQIIRVVWMENIAA
jgi:hypothetical protein